MDGETYVKQALPPWVDHLTFTVDNLVAEMDYVGVDMALLHRTPYMSKSNEFIAECVRAYPDRIQGLAYIEEWLLASDTDACIKKAQSTQSTTSACTGTSSCPTTWPCTASTGSGQAQPSRRSGTH